MKTENRAGLLAVSAAADEITRVEIVQLGGKTMGDWYAAQTDKPDMMLNASLWDGKGAIGTIWQDGQMVRNEGTGYGFGVNNTGDWGFGDPWAVNWRDYITGYPALVRDGKALSHSVDSYVMTAKTKRSVVAAAGNRLYLITADRMTVAELRAALIQFGAYHAINLDGGGSARLLVHGKSINNPTDDRRCPNAIAVWLRKAEKPGKEDEPMDKIKIAVDAGHGLYTAGKRCLKSLDAKETREWTLNSRIADEVVRLLNAAGCDTLRVDDTTGKTDVALSVRTHKANEWKADAYISIHHDSGVSGGSGGGATVFAYTSASKKSLELRDTVYNEYIKAGGIKGNRSTPLSTANFHVLRETSMPAILIECGFMDSATDVPVILSDDFYMKAARGIASGVAKALGFTLKDNAEDNKNTTAQHWAQGCLDSLVNKGLITDPSQWNNFDASLSTLTIGQLLALIDKATG